MTNTTKFVLGVIGVIGLVMLVVSQLNKPTALGADVMTNPQWFYNGSYFGKGNWFVGGNAGDSSFGVSANADGSSPVFSISSAGALSASAMSITSLVAGTFTQGGGVTSVATTSTTYTLSASEFDTENVIDVTPGGASLLLTLPASSTLPLSTTAGASRTVWIRNATTTAGVNITVAGGAGDFMKSASTTFVLMSSAGTSTQARLELVRRSNSDISVMFTPFNH